MEKLRLLTPVIALMLVLGCTAFSLSGFQPSETGSFSDQVQAASVNDAPVKKLAKKKTLPEKEKNEPKGSSEVSEAKEDCTYKDGVYYGSGMGFRGMIKVKVTIRKGKIADIDVVSSPDDAAYFNRAKKLLSSIISRQTTNVDTVSGATYSSVGLIKAVRDALSKAVVSGSEKPEKENDIPLPEKDKPKKTEPRKPVTPGEKGKFPYPDGTYTGSAMGYCSQITAAVTLKNKSITKIRVVSQDDDEEYFSRALVVLKDMVKAQSTQVDTVTGATYSSRGLINAVKEALKKAKAAAEKDPGKDEDPEDDPGDEPAPPEDGYKFNDGIYTVSVPCYPLEDDPEFDEYDLSMTVTIKNDRITRITGVRGNGDGENDSFIKRAANLMIPAIIKAGNADSADTVSGTTCTAESIIAGCSLAFQQARK